MVSTVLPVNAAESGGPTGLSARSVRVGGSVGTETTYCSPSLWAAVETITVRPPPSRMAPSTARPGTLNAAASTVRGSTVSEKPTRSWSGPADVADTKVGRVLSISTGVCTTDAALPVLSTADNRSS